MIYHISGNALLPLEQTDKPLAPVLDFWGVTGHLKKLTAEQGMKSGDETKK